jgi:hypothetical protein
MIYQLKIDFDLINTIIYSIGALLTGIGVIYAAIQLRISRKIGRSEFLIRLYELMEKHNELHLKLTVKGFDLKGGTQPLTPDDWLDIGQLMGTFEYIHILVQDKILDVKTVDLLFSYRIIPILKNKHIYDRYFSSENNYWLRFSALVQLLENQSTFGDVFKNYEKIYSNIKITKNENSRKKNSSANTRRKKLET